MKLTLLPSAFDLHPVMEVLLSFSVGWRLISQDLLEASKGQQSSIVWTSGC